MTNTTNKLVSRFRNQYVLESLLIIVSILIAFAIDAWWDERQDRAEETRLLHALRAEFQENADTIPAFIARRTNTVNLVNELMGDMHAAGFGATVTATSEQVTAYTVHGSFDASSGAFDAMMQSGGIRLIENRELQQRLARWPRMVADTTENDHYLRNVAGPRVFAYLASRVDFGVAGQFMICRAENPVGDCPSADFEITASRELSSLLFPISGWSGEAARELEEMRIEARDLVRIIDEELAD